MERKIGEIFEFNGEWYQCVKGGGCNCCDLLENGICVNDFSLNGSCFSHQREDETRVIFKKLEKVGEPIVYMSRTFQRLKLLDTEQCKYCYFRNQVCNPQLCEKETFLVEIKQTKEEMEEKKLTYEELKHYYDSTCGLWAIDRNPEQVTLEWIVENAFQLGDTIHEKVCASNLKPFDLEAAKAGKSVCTRDGHKARIICFDRKDNTPIVALIERVDGIEILQCFYNDGKYFHDPTSDNDLMMLPEKHEGWVNICKESFGDDSVVLGYIFSTREDAVKSAKNNDRYIDTAKISWEE